MKIEVGKSYRTRDGRKAHVTDKGIGSTFFYHALINGSGYTYTVEGNFGIDRVSNLDLVAEWVDEPKTWGEMTPEEKGALLLAKYEGKKIQALSKNDPNGSWYLCNPNWYYDDLCYRVKPEPEVKQVSLFCGSMRFDPDQDYGPVPTYGDTHKIIFNLVDGKPDCSSIQMEEL